MKERKVEKITSSAIRYTLKGETGFKYVTGRSHADCISWFSFADIPAKLRYTDMEVQGFMTSEGRFVDRYIGKAIATAAGQIKRDYPYDYLISEYINWNM